MSSLLPRFSTSNNKTSHPSISDSHYTSPRNLVSHTTSFNPTLSRDSGEYQASKVLPSDIYNDSLTQKYMSTPEKPYHVKAISESSKPFHTRKVDYGFNLDMPEIGSMQPNDSHVQTPSRRILNRNQRLSEDNKDMLLHSSNAPLASELKRPYDYPKTDRYTDLISSQFDLTSSSSKAMLSHRGDNTYETPVKPVASSHTKQIYQQTALQLLGGRQETPKAAITKFNSAQHINEPTSSQYFNTESNQNSRLLPIVGVGNMNPKLREQLNKQEPVSTRARIGHESTCMWENPFNVGLLNLKSPTTVASQVEAQLSKGVFSLKESKLDTSSDVVPGKKISNVEPERKASFIIKKRTPDSDSNKYMFSMKKIVSENDSQDRQDRQDSRSAFLSKKSIPETQERHVYSNKKSMADLESYDRQDNRSDNRPAFLSKKSVPEVVESQEKFVYNIRTSIQEVAEPQERFVYISKNSIPEAAEPQEKPVHGKKSHVETMEPQERSTLFQHKKNNSEMIETYETSRNAKKSSFDLLEIDKVIEPPIPAKNIAKMSTQASLEMGHASLPVIKNISSGSSNNVFDLEDNKVESLPMISEVAEIKGVKPILRIRFREPLKSQDDKFLMPTEKKVVFDLPVGHRDREEEAVEENAFKKFKAKLKKKAKKLVTKPTLKSILWGMTITTLWNEAVKNKNEYRIMRNKEFSLNFNSDKQIFLEFAAEYLKDPLVKLAQEKNKLSIVGPKSSIRDINSRCVKIHDHILSLLSALKCALETNFLPGSIYKNIVSSFRNGSSVPDYYLSEYELERLQFTPSFALKCMNIFRSKMLIGGYILLRILLLEVIMRPWQALPKIQSSKINVNNLQTIGSVIYHAVKDIFAETLNPVRITPECVNLDDRAKVSLDIASPTAKSDKKSEPTFDGFLGREEEEDEKDEIIKGFGKRDALAHIIVDRSILYQDIKTSLGEILEFLHRVTYKGVKKEKSYYLKDF